MNRHILVPARRSIAGRRRSPPTTTGGTAATIGGGTTGGGTGGTGGSGGTNGTGGTSGTGGTGGTSGNRNGNTVTTQLATGQVFTQVGAFQLTGGSQDSALVADLSPRAYTVQVQASTAATTGTGTGGTGTGGTGTTAGNTGDVLVEVYFVQ